MTIEQLSDGIYFGLDENIYHAQERMSSSGISNMLISPADFWARSWMNPNKEEQDNDTPARIIGRATHCAVLEPHLMDMKYFPKVDYSSYEGMLTTGKQIEEQLEKKGEPKTVKGELVLDKALRLKAAGYSGSIKHIIDDQWERARGDRQAVESRDWDFLRAQLKEVQRQGFRDNCLKDGFSEVSVFWTDERTGIKMKCRFDYLNAEYFTDLKTFDNPQGKYLDQCLHNAFQYNRYYIQAYIYREATELIRAGKVGQVEGYEWSEPEAAMIDKIRARVSSMPIIYMFAQKSGVNNIVAREVRIMTPVHESHTNNDAGVDPKISEEAGERTRRLSSLGLKAQAEVNHSLNHFNLYSETYEVGEPWGALQPFGVIDDDCFSTFFLEKDQ